MTRLAPLLAALLMLAATGVGAAQERARVRIGLGGQPVAEAWNPIAVEVRDLPGADILVEIDAGSLQHGSVPQSLRWSLPASGGLQRREGELFLPSWRSLSWRVRHGPRVVASGALGPRDRDPRPLDVVVSAEPGRWRQAYPEEARLVGVAAPDLPQRAGAWDGVRSLLIDGSAAAPRAEALLAAAGAGVAVVVLEPLSAGHAALEPLLAGGSLGVGAGRIAGRTREAHEQGVELAPPPPRRALEEALAAATPQPEWSHPSGAAVAALAGAYGAALLLLLRYGGAPGLLSALLLALAAGAVAAPWLRPPEVAPTEAGTLSIGAGGLAYRIEARHVTRLPEGEAVLNGAWRALEPRTVRWEEARTLAPLEAAGRLGLAAVPTLTDPPLAWRDGRVVNLSDRAWPELWIVGSGAQGRLEADEAMETRPGAGAPPAEWAEVAARLPEGAALATGPGAAAVALPPDAAWSWPEAPP